MYTWHTAWRVAAWPHFPAPQTAGPGSQLLGSRLPGTSGTAILESEAKTTFLSA